MDDGSGHSIPADSITSVRYIPYAAVLVTVLMDRPC